MPPKKKAAAAGAKEVEQFFGVYLLYCTNPKYKGRTYIGYTVDPNRRIDQHNKGKHAGGAWRTSNRGPWEMVLIVHGFPNDISALRFEWSWQHPARSRRLRHVPPKESFIIKLHIAKNYRKTKMHMCPPLHMPIVHGPVRSIKVKSSSSSKLAAAADKDGEDIEMDEQLFCNICFKTVSSGEKMECLNLKCGAVSHIICLSLSFLASEDNQIIPIEGNCVTCETVLQWGDMVRKKNGCYNNLTEEDMDASFQD